MHPTAFTSIPTLLKSLAATHLTWFALHGHGAGWAGIWSLGGPVATDLPGSDGEERGRARHHADGAGISDSDCWRGVNSLVWEQISPVSGVSLCFCFTFSHSSQWRNEHRWLRGERKSEQRSQCDCVCACVSVSDCWLLEYKWDVLIHLNQGHMLGPRVKCSERNEALYCICHSAQEKKPGTFSALHEILRVTFKQSVVINWLHDWPDCKSFSYFHVPDIFVVSRKWVIFGLFFLYLIYVLQYIFLFSVPGLLF